MANLPFLSKVNEKIIAAQLHQNMSKNNLLDKMQSAYKCGHSTETALLRVQNDLLQSIDKGKCVFLILLDLSAAFDTVDHNILLTFLKDYVGLAGSVWSMFQTYLTGRTQCVTVDNILSNLTEPAFRVPQGSVLGPLIFCTYTLPLGAILRQHNMGYHIYADDTQLYCSFDKDTATDTLSSIIHCVSDIRSWMIRSKLKINDDKTEFLVLSSPRAKVPSNLNLSIGQATISSSSSCRNLGVVLDDHLDMNKHISSICRSTHFHLRNIGAIRHLLTDTAASQVVHALITSRLDYCNSLLYGIPDNKLCRLQRIQNIAARITSRCSKHCHITPVLKELHWLPVKIRILF